MKETRMHFVPLDLDKWNDYLEWIDQQNSIFAWEQKKVNEEYTVAIDKWRELSSKIEAQHEARKATIDRAHKDWEQLPWYKRWLKEEPDIFGFSYFQRPHIPPMPSMPIIFSNRRPNWEEFLTLLFEGKFEGIA